MSTPSVSPGDALERDPRFRSGDPVEVVKAAGERFGPHGLAVVSSFGPGTMALFDMMARQGIRLPVVFIDTLYHFPETLQHVERARRRYDLDVWIYPPAESREGFEARYGPRLWERDLALYQQVSKVQPFRRATERLVAYVTGRRRDQASTRAALPVVESTTTPVRVNPLATWSRHDIWDYLERYGVPVNPLHHLGYASIGDAPLTTPVARGEHERAGRWRGTDVLECGIHAFGGRPNTRSRTQPPEERTT